jgi:transposase-like protein
MAVRDIVPVPGASFEETLRSASPDLLREMIRGFAQRMMDAEVETVCNAGYGEVTADRVNSRNGYRAREWDTRAGTVELAIPKLRQGSYFPGFLEHRRRAERALASVVATSYLLGVSTRRVEKLAESLGVTKLSKSQVSVMAGELDEMVAGFRNRRLDGAPYAFVWLDALTQKVREGGRTVNVHALIATGVSAEGKREILGIDVASSEDGAGWLAFLRGLVARGLSGVQLVTSDCHQGLRDAIASVLPGAAWQRCRAHYHRNLLTKVPRSAQPWVSTLVRTIFEQPDAASVRAQHSQVVTALEAKFPAAAAHLDDARDDVLAFTAFPREVWRQIWSNNPQERLNKEIRRRTDVVGIFPGRDAIIRLIGAVLAEQNDEWTEARRYMGPEILAACTKPAGPEPGNHELTIEVISA